MLKKIEYVRATLLDLKDFIKDQSGNEKHGVCDKSTNEILESLNQLLMEIQSEIWKSYGLTETLNMLSLGISIVRRDGEISYLNASAKDILEDYKSITHKDGVSHLAGKISSIANESIRFSRVRNYYSDKVIIQIEPLGKQDLKQVSPLASDRRGGAVVLIRRNSQHSLPSPEQLEDIFGLSTAEAKLVLMLLGGKTIKQSADILCIAESTARTQIRNILGKTGAKRMQDLMSLLLSTPATLRSQK